MKQILLMSLLSFLFGANAQQSDNITILSKEDFKNSLNKETIQLVDVRTKKEFDSGHIPKATNIDFFKQSEFIALFSKLDKNAPVYLYCRSGNRSQKAAKKLVDLGFTKVYDLKGGYLIW